MYVIKIGSHAAEGLLRQFCHSLAILEKSPVSSPSGFFNSVGYQLGMVVDVVLVLRIFVISDLDSVTLVEYRHMLIGKEPKVVMDSVLMLVYYKQTPGALWFSSLTIHPPLVICWESLFIKASSICSQEVLCFPVRYSVRKRLATALSTKNAIICLKVIILLKSFFIHAIFGMLEKLPELKNHSNVFLREKLL